MRHASTSLPVWKPVLFGALAGGMGWGIRGQYGHETGAMIAGALVSLTLALLLVPRAAAGPALRAAAWGTVALGFGGSMTYGQTVGLTHDPALVGNEAAWRWGMLGLAIKGSIWIGFAGVFLGMGFGGVRYRARELAGVMAMLLGACVVGWWLFNTPFEPAQRQLPRIYFSADWRWMPDAALKPRPEIWGGMLVSLVTLLAYTRAWRGDRLALRLGLWGMLGGALGFPIGQSLQAWHAWHRADFQTGFWAGLEPHMNWWNMMETTFGTIMGATLGLGAWIHRRDIQLPEKEPVEGPDLPFPWPGILLVLHVALLAAVEFLSLPVVDFLYDFGLALGLIPVVGIATGRFWPLAAILPVTAIPIAGKTFANAVSEPPAVPVPLAVVVFLIVPLAGCTWAAIHFGRRAARGVPADEILRPLLLLVTGLYFGLNYAFFRFPWPWAPWTTRTPNGILFTLCAAGLAWLAWSSRSGAPPGQVAQGSPSTGGAPTPSSGR